MNSNKASTSLSNLWTDPEHVLAYPSGLPNTGCTSRGILMESFLSNGTTGFSFLENRRGFPTSRLFWSLPEANEIILKFKFFWFIFSHLFLVGTVTGVLLCRSDLLGLSAHPQRYQRLLFTAGRSSFKLAFPTVDLYDSPP